jgi:ADP-heptose:LPS heptosyltransferase
MTRDRPLTQLAPAIQTIAIVRALPGLGDFLCAVPALRALRAAFPTARILLIGLAQSQSWVERYGHYLDGRLPFPGFPGIPEVPFSARQTVLALRDIQQFDLVLQLHGNGCWLNSFALLLGARFTAGCCLAGQCPDPDWFLTYPEQASEVWRCLQLLRFLGIPLQGDDLEFPVKSGDWQEWQTLVAAYRLRHYICLHPGASVGAKCWQPRHFATVADALAAQGWSVVLTGTAAEAELVKAVAAQMIYPAIDLAGQTSLGGLALLLKHSRLLICNDTGISHLAAALKVNSVVIFSDSDPQRWAPLNRQRHRIVGAAGSYATTAQVLEAALDLLDEELVYAY